VCLLFKEQYLMKTLVVAQDAFEEGGNSLSHVLHLMKTANSMFNLRYDPKFFDRLLRARDDFAELYTPNPKNPNLDSIWGLHYFAASKQFSPEQYEEIYREGPCVFDPASLDGLRAAGLSDIADIHLEFYNLIDDFEFEIIPDDPEPPYVELINKDELEEKRSALVAKLSEAVVRHNLSSAEAVLSRIPGMEHVELRSFEEFQRAWLEEIVSSKTFRKLKPRKFSTKNWLLPNKPYGWLTQRHAGALESHGYTYHFAFWEQEIGNSRGHLWIQTAKGPVRLTDDTDSIWLSSNFPVQVSDIHGEPLFELQESDVPQELLRSASPSWQEMRKDGFKVDIPINEA
jgi:hypothetical protein